MILDIDAYPRWVRGYRRATVTKRDSEQRPAEAGFSVGGFGLTASYTLAYSYDDDPLTVRFEQVDGDLTRSISGRYELHPDGDSTELLYAAEVELAVPTFGHLRRAAERIVIDSALRSLEGEVHRRAAVGP